MWEKASSIAHKVSTTLIQHVNPGVRNNAIKCLQIMILVQSRNEAGSSDKVSFGYNVFRSLSLCVLNASISMTFHLI